MIEIFYRRWNNSIHKSSFMIILTFLLELYKSNNIYQKKKGEGFHFLTNCNDINFTLSEKWFSQLYRFHFFPSCKFTLLKEQKGLFKTKVNWSKSCHVWCLKCSHIIPSWLGWGLSYRLTPVFPHTYLDDSTQRLKGKWVLWKNELKQVANPATKWSSQRGSFLLQRERLRSCKARCWWLNFLCVFASVGNTPVFSRLARGGWCLQP